MNKLQYIKYIGELQQQEYKYIPLTILKDILDNKPLGFVLNE